MISAGIISGTPPRHPGLTRQPKGNTAAETTVAKSLLILNVVAVAVELTESIIVQRPTVSSLVEEGGGRGQRRDITQTLALCVHPVGTSSWVGATWTKH